MQNITSNVSFAKTDATNRSPGRNMFQALKRYFTKAFCLVNALSGYIYLRFASKDAGVLILLSQITFEKSSAAGFRFAIVVSRWNEALTSSLRLGAYRAFLDSGAAEDAIETFVVPGAFELPLASKKAAETGRFDAVVALGVVIRGDTPHFDFVAGQASAGIMQASLSTGVPIMFGVVTTNTLDQAKERCGADNGNKGYEAALSAIEVAALFREMRNQDSIKVSPHVA
jgi:6,7-dimethyl-8-ribityllumazine synthase